MDLTLDMAKLTLGDMADWEEYTGKPLTSLAGVDVATLSAKEMIAVVWLAGRQDNPSFTLEDAKRMPLSEIEVARPLPNRAARRASAGKRAPTVEDDSSSS